jgi:hypothetical protein
MQLAVTKRLFARSPSTNGVFSNWPVHFSLLIRQQTAYFCIPTGYQTDFCGPTSHMGKPPWIDYANYTSRNPAIHRKYLP